MAEVNALCHPTSIALAEAYTEGIGDLESILPDFPEQVYVQWGSGSSGNRSIRDWHAT